MMDKLPLELVPHIFEALEEHKHEDPFDKSDLLTGALSDESVKAICNLRLASRNFYHGSGSSFAKAISRHEFSVTQKSIDALDKILDNKKVSYHIDSLTFNNDVPFLPGLLRRQGMNYLIDLATLQQRVDLGVVVSLRDVEKQNRMIEKRHHLYHMSDEPKDKLKAIFRKCPKLRSVQFLQADPKCWKVQWPDQEVAAILAEIVKKETNLRMRDNWLNHFGSSSFYTLGKAMGESSLALTSLSVHGQRVSSVVRAPMMIASPIRQRWVELASHNFSSIRALDLEFSSDDTNSHARFIQDTVSFLGYMSGITTLRLDIAQHGTLRGNPLESVAAMTDSLFKTLNSLDETLIPNLTDFCLIGNFSVQSLAIFLAKRASTLRTFRLQPTYYGKPGGDMSLRLHDREKKLDELLESLIGILNLDYLTIREPSFTANAPLPMGIDVGSYERRRKWEPMLMAIAKHYRVDGSRMTCYKMSNRNMVWFPSERIEGVVQRVNTGTRNLFGNGRKYNAVGNSVGGEVLTNDFEWKSCWTCTCHRNKVLKVKKLTPLEQFVQIDDESMATPVDVQDYTLDWY
ncbi:hypothetical protein K490DRAFT_64109 [Saccharata proteae CBS 121410]|uniref:Uncharacterized protein n=1 Tax=Saccharata proteae CBS 121410 TaxID=1314787 RepID=A0A6A5YC33_9PEZI|nr:hypothetical protein K490DRAFT_64109 [Saccharata proteae CBS 121410]